MKHLKKTLLYFLILLNSLILSCTDSQDKELPKGLLEKSVFTEVLLEMQLVEAHLNEIRVEQAYLRDSANNFFKEVLEKYNVTFEEFNTTMGYYTSRPGELQEIYNNIIDKLSVLEAELADVNVIEESISPIGKHQIVNIVVQTPVYNLYFDTLYTASQIQDSLFKYLKADSSILNTFETNLTSFQKSYIGITYKDAMYNSLKEEIKRNANKPKI